MHLCINQNALNDSWMVRERRPRRPIKETLAPKARMSMEDGVKFGLLHKGELDTSQSTKDILDIYLPRRVCGYLNTEPVYLPIIVPTEHNKDLFKESKDQRDLPQEISLVDKLSGYFLKTYMFNEEMSLHDLYTELINPFSKYHQGSTMEDRVTADTVIAVFFVDTNEVGELEVTHYYPRRNLSNIGTSSVIPLRTPTSKVEFDLHVTRDMKKHGMQRFFCLFLPAYVSCDV